jgi:predicted PurR-regulated permease PerM
MEQEQAGEAATPPTIWPVVQGVSVLLVLAYFLWSAGSVLNPLFLFVILVAVLLPFRGWPGHSLLLGVTGLMTALWLLSTTGGLLAPFILALGLAYVLDPVTDAVQRRVGGRRGLAIAVLALPVVALLTVGVVFGVPALASQLGELIARTPVLVERLGAFVTSLEARLEGLPGVGEILVDHIEQVDAEAIVAFLEERRAMLAEHLWGGVLGIGRGLGAAVTVLGYVILTPVLTFYLLRDWDAMVARIGDMVPPAHRDGLFGFAREYDHLLARFLRGQVLVALTVGSITAVGFWITGFPYALLMGVLVAVFGVIPYLGLALSLLPAVIIALVSGNVLLSLIKVAGVFGVAQGLEGTVISPRIVGESVGLHPVWVVLALSLGGFYFGFAGLLLGVPGAVGVKLVVVRALSRYRDSHFFRNGSESEA